MNKRELQKEKRRYTIMGEAAEIFIRKGFKGTKIADIALASGMSAGLMFHYFDSKESLFETLINLGISGPKNIFEKTQANSPLEFFESVTAQIFELIKKQPFMAKMFVLMGNAAASEDVPKSCKKLVHSVDYASYCLPKIEEGQQAGVIKNTDAGSLFLAYWSSVKGIAQAIALNSALPCPEPAIIVDILKAH